MTKILILDDEALVAQVLEMSMMRAGFDVQPVTLSVQEALQSIDREKPNFALLDVNLGDETSFPVAEKLTDLRIPFCFFTAYSQTSVPSIYSDVPIIPKTTPRQVIMETIRSVIDQYAG